MSTPKRDASHAGIQWRTARQHFESVDREFHGLIKALPDPDPSPERTAFESLARAIIGQQLSTKAAATIWSRFEAHHGGLPSPMSVLETPQEAHRSLGVSGQKHGYLQSLAEHVQASPADFNHVSDWTDDDILRRWTEVKGLGKWTVQMHLMFALKRPDVFPVDDLGIRRSMEQHLGMEIDGPRGDYEKRARIWGPFRTAASRFLWMLLENQPK